MKTFSFRKVMFAVVGAISPLLVAGQSFGSVRDYQQAFAHLCTPVNYSGGIYNQFVIRSLVDVVALQEKGISEFYSLENMQSGNGDFAVSLSVMQSEEGSEDLVVPEQLLEGCQKVKSFIQEEDQSVWYFDCAGDGDAGTGSMARVSDGQGGDKVEAKVEFPEGKSDLSYPIANGAAFELSCRGLE